MELICIVPRLPPRIDGIGDYALVLARELRRKIGINTTFVVCDRSWPELNRPENFEVRRITSHSADELLSLLDDTLSANQLLLHYEGYGYAQRGCPFWLVEALERWRLASEKRRLVTMFHELYAKGPPWTSSFWLSPLQKRLTTRLARLSDQWSTSLEKYAHVVEKISGNKSSTRNHLAVFSSIGEPRSTLSLNERRRRLVVFGTRGRRIEVYKRSADDLNRICGALGIDEVVDIGRSVDFDISSVVKVPIVTFGELVGSKVSEILLDSVAGVVDYPASMLGKSTIFAAYCSHRLIPIIANYADPIPRDHLEEGRHYWRTTIQSKRLNLDAGQVIADNALAWYRTHDLSTHGRNLAALFASTGNGIQVPLSRYEQSRT